MRNIKMNLKVVCALSCLILELLIPAAPAQSVRSASTEVQLISENDAVIPGEPFWVALQMTMDPEWHSYWKNPGDSGYPTMIDWQLPEGFQTSEIVWPSPKRIDVDILTTYAFEGTIYLLTQITPPALLPPSVMLKADVNWLACKDICIPGTAKLELLLPTASFAAENIKSNQAVFAQARSQLPRTAEGKFQAFEDQQYYYLQFDFSDYDPATIQFFPEKNDIIVHSAKQNVVTIDGRPALQISKEDQSHKDVVTTLQGIFVLRQTHSSQEQNQAYTIDLGIQPYPVKTSPPAANTASVGLFAALVFAFLGGLILNLMPCVLPVLSLKLLSIFQQAHHDRKKILRHGLVFSSGILCSFWMLVVILEVLKVFGKQVGWGFQFQSPAFVVFMALLFYWMGLNLWGIFEIGLALTQRQNISKETSYGASFFNGVLATVVATPCTAPFMGSAMGYALTQPPGVVWLIFTALALGLSFPFLLISKFPATLQFIPKPGRWMTNLKKIFGVFFMGTVIWLMWVLEAQRGRGAIQFLIFGLVSLTVSAILLGRFATISSPQKQRKIAKLISAFIALTGLIGAFYGTSRSAALDASKTVNQEGGIRWLNFTPELLQQMRNSGRITFIDFTAKWCLSCQVNDRVVFNNESVIRKFKELNIVPIKADWTNYNESITEALTALGKNSIPVYALYPRGSQEPILLPEIITPQIMLKELNKLQPQ